MDRGIIVVFAQHLQRIVYFQEKGQTSLKNVVHRIVLMDFVWGAGLFLQKMVSSVFIILNVDHKIVVEIIVMAVV
jgi:putative flippase GtrA